MSATRKKRRIGATADVLRRANDAARQRQLQLRTHVLVGHPVRDIVELAAELEVELLVIGAVGHSALYERLDPEVARIASSNSRIAPCSSSNDDAEPVRARAEFVNIHGANIHGADASRSMEHDMTPDRAANAALDVAGSKLSAGRMADLARPRPL